MNIYKIQELDYYNSDEIPICSKLPNIKLLINNKKGETKRSFFISLARINAFIYIKLFKSICTSHFCGVKN